MRKPRLCAACENGDHQNCGLQTWCECDCDPGMESIGNWLTLPENESLFGEDKDDKDD